MKKKDFSELMRMFKFFIFIYLFFLKDSIKVHKVVRYVVISEKLIHELTWLLQNLFSKAMILVQLVPSISAAPIITGTTIDNRGGECRTVRRSFLWSIHSSVSEAASLISRD